VKHIDIHDIVPTTGSSADEYGWFLRPLFHLLFDTINELTDEVSSLKEEVSKLNKSENQ
jgi:hypothetical protein